MWIKTTVRYYFAPTWMTIINKTENIKHWWGSEDIAGGIQNSVTSVENSWAVLQQPDMELLYNPPIPLLGIYWKRIENRGSSYYLYTNVHCSIIHSSQKVETFQVPVNR